MRYVMRLLITLILCLLTLPSMAQVDSVTNSSVEFTLPNSVQFDYSRDMLAHLDDQWALDNVQLAFFISEQEGQEVEIPLFAADTLMQVIDQLALEVQNLAADLSATRDSLSTERLENADMRAEYNYALQRARELTEFIRNQ